MATIEVKIEINSNLDNVWDVISDIDKEPKFWKGTKQVKNISKEGNIINREITIAFRDQKCLQQVTLEPKKQIKAKFTKGILNGEKIMTITPKGEKTILFYHRKRRDRPFRVHETSATLTKYRKLQQI